MSSVVTIFEVSTRNQTPTNFNASAMKTRTKKFVLSLLASFCPPLASGVALLTKHFYNRVHTLPALNQRVPRLSVATNCHGRTQFLPCWLCNCGPLPQTCPSRGSSIQSVVDHCPPEGPVADVPVVDAFVFPFTAFLCKICRMVFFASWSFSIPVTTWSVFSDVEVRYGE